MYVTSYPSIGLPDHIAFLFVSTLWYESYGTLFWLVETKATFLHNRQLSNELNNQGMRKRTLDTLFYMPKHINLY